MLTPILVERQQAGRNGVDGMIARRTAVTNDLLADDGYVQKVDTIGDPLQKIKVVVDFAPLAQAVEKIAPRPEQPKGGRPPYPTEVMVRVLVVKRLHGLSDEQTEFQLLNRRSFRRFCGLEPSRNIPDRTTIWNFENRIGGKGSRPCSTSWTDRFVLMA